MLGTLGKMWGNSVGRRALVGAGIGAGYNWYQGNSVIGGALKGAALGSLWGRYGRVLLGKGGGNAARRISRTGFLIGHDVGRAYRWGSKLWSNKGANGFRAMP